MAIFKLEDCWKIALESSNVVNPNDAQVKALDAEEQWKKLQQEFSGT